MRKFFLVNFTFAVLFEARPVAESEGMLDIREV